MSTFLIKLYPVDRYFFGSETTFGPDNINYFVRSAYFPQQTTILGMLRYYLLLQNDLLDKNGAIKDEDAAGILIGKNSFDPADAQDFRIIQNISPVFISAPEGEYFAQSREHGFNYTEDEVTGEKKKELIQFKLRGFRNGSICHNKPVYYLDGLTAKSEIPELYVNARTGQTRFSDHKKELKSDPMNGFFISHEQVGIRIPDDETIKDPNKKKKGYYRQVGFTMLPEYSFAFYAEIDKKTGIRFESGMVRMGADQSWFRIEITQMQYQTS